MLFLPMRFKSLGLWFLWGCLARLLRVWVFLRGEAFLRGEVFVRGGMFVGVGRGGGFALVVGLMVMGCLMLVTFALAGWLSLELRLVGGRGERERVHLAVVAAGRMALGELQLRVGGDRVVSFPFVDGVRGGRDGVARDTAGWDEMG